MGKCEIAHRMNSDSFYSKSHTCRTVNLRNDLKKISRSTNAKSSGEAEATGGEGQSKMTINSTVIDLYAKRHEKTEWSEIPLFSRYEKELDGMNLDKFAKLFVVGHSGRHKNKIKVAPEKSFVMFKPQLSSDKKLPTYKEYSKLSLVRYKPWKNDIHEVYGGQDATEDNWVRSWEEYKSEIIKNSENGEAPDHNYHLMRQLRNTSSDYLGGLIGDDDDDCDGEDAGFNALGPADDILDDELELEEWEKSLESHKNFDGCYEDLGEFAEIKKRYDGIVMTNDNDSNQQQNVEEVDKDDLNAEQRQFYDIIERLIKYDEHESESDEGNGFHRGVVLRGRGGTGKSYAVNAVRSSDFLGPGEEITTATTGKAAMLLNGSTIYSASRGLKLPVGRQKFVELNGPVLKHLQKVFEKVKILFIDEYSMLPQKMLWYIHRRLQQLKCSTRPFGGIIVVLIGDLAQLPPVNALSVWDERSKPNGKKKDDVSAYGERLWKTHFGTVITLEENKRVDETDPDSVFLNKFLKQVADGNVDEKGWETIIKNCSRQTMGDHEWKNRGFEGEDVTHLFMKNSQVLDHNHKRLKKLAAPILRVNAVNNNAKARKKASDSFQQLPNHAFYAIDSKVLLTRNIKPIYGLANGSTGYVKGFVWDTSVTDETISDATSVLIWADFKDQYTGKPFFTDDKYKESRRGWVPIFASQVDIYEATGSGEKGYDTLSRAMIPLKLAWAWTIHKAQGQTMKGKIVIDLGDKEVTVGLSYVAFSRATNLRNIGINGGCARERLMEEISNKPYLKLRKKADEALTQLTEKTKRKLFEERLMEE